MFRVSLAKIALYESDINGKVFLNKDRFYRAAIQVIMATH